MKDSTQEHRWKALKETDVQDDHCLSVLSLCLDCGLLKLEPKVIPGSAWPDDVVHRTRYYRWTKESGQAQPRCEIFYEIDTRDLMRAAAETT